MINIIKKHKWKWIIGSILFIIIGYPFVYKTADNYQCLDCLTTKKIYRVHYLFDFLKSEDTTIIESYFYRNFIPSNHEHIWKYKQGNYWDYFGGFMCSLGAHRHTTPFAQELEPNWHNKNPERDKLKERVAFHVFIENKIKKGDLTKDDVIKMSLIKHSSDLINKKSQSLID